MTPLKLFDIDVEIENSNIDFDIKNFLWCHMTPTQTHDTLLFRKGNTETSMSVKERQLRYVTYVR